MSTRVVNTEVGPSGVGEDALTHYLRVFTKFLQLVFSTWDKSQYKWTPDPKTTDIHIQAESAYVGEVMESRPAIIVSRGATAFTNVSMNQFAGPLMERDPATGQTTFSPNYDPNSGAKTHTDLLSSTMTYACLSSQGIEAQRIAWTCAYATRVLKKTLLRAGIHRVGEDIQVGTESPPGSLVVPDTTEMIMVPVYVPFFFQQTYTIAPKDKLLLNQVNIALSSELNYPSVNSTPIRDAGINGRVIGYTNVLKISQAATAGPYKSPRPRRI